MDDSQQWMEYRRMTSEVRRCRDEDGRRIAELEVQLDTAHAYDRYVSRRRDDPDAPCRYDDDEAYDGLGWAGWLLLILGGSLLWGLFAVAMWVLEGGL